MTYAKETQQKINNLEKQKRRLEDEATEIDERIEDLKVGESPIQPGHVVEWSTSGNRIREGEVISVSSGYRGYEYRCVLLSKIAKQPIGFATINEGHCPLIIRKTKRSKLKPRTVKTRKSTK